MLYARANGNNFSGSLMSHDQRWNPATRVAEITVEVRPTDANRPHTNEDFTILFRKRNGQLHDLQFPLGSQHERPHRFQQVIRHLSARIRRGERLSPAYVNRPGR